MGRVVLSLHLAQPWLAAVLMCWVSQVNLDSNDGRCLSVAAGVECCTGNGVGDAGQFA